MKSSKDKPGGEHQKIQNNLPQTVAVVYSEVKREYFPTEDQYITEKDAQRDALVIGEYLKKLNIKPLLYPGDPELPFKLKKDKPDLVLNLVASVRGNEYLCSSVPAMLEYLDIHYTGADSLGISLSCNKFLTKEILLQNKIPTPHYQLFNTPTDTLDSTLRFPLISKLNEIHGAVEITQESVYENEKLLRSRLKYLINTYNQPVIVEEYIVGKEITAYLLEGVKKKVYMAEKIFSNSKNKYTFADFKTQWIGTDTKISYEKYKDDILQEYIKKAFDVTRMSDYGKFDIRIDNSGRYYFLDSNSNPFFGPIEIESPMANILELYGVSFIETLKRLLANTMREAQNIK
jgi:D-alanine-D-alanine ligase